MKKYEEVHAMPPAQANQALAAHLGTLPDFEEAGATETGVWARFTDGRVAVMVNDPSIDAALAAHTKHASRAAAARAARLAFGIAAAPEIPSGKRFHAYDVIGDDDTSAARNDVAQWLSAQSYEEVKGKGLLDELVFDDKDGVLYFNTHGGFYALREGCRDLAQGTRCGRDAGGRLIKAFSMMTGTPVLDENGHPIRHDVGSPEELPAPEDERFDDGELTYFFGPIGDAPEGQWNYGITSAFVEKNWNFGRNAFAMLPVCWSMNTDSDPTGNVQIAYTHKLAVTVGWTSPVLVPDGLAGARFGLDRLLGANRTDAWHDVRTPRERPWSWSNVFQEVLALGKGTSKDQTHDAKMTWVGTDVILAPSIATIDVDEEHGQVVLRGAFGSDPGDGEVTIAPDDKPDTRGTSLSGCAWQPDLVRCDLADGHQAGYVRAIAHGHESNAVALTRFHPRLHWHMIGQVDKGRIELDAWVDAIVRMDVQTYRRRPMDDPRPREPFQMSASKDSTCNFQVVQPSYGTDKNGQREKIEGGKSGRVVSPFLGLPELPPGAPEIAREGLLARPVPGACTFGGYVDPANEMRLGVTVALMNDVTFPMGIGALVFHPEMLADPKNEREKLQHLTVHVPIVTSPDGTVTIVGGHLASPPGGKATTTLDWADARGEFPPPDPQSAR